MTYKILIEKNGAVGAPQPAGIELLQIGGNVTAPSFGSIDTGNARFNDASNLVTACANSLKSEITRPGIVFIYRGVAVGGLQHGLGGFSSKPLTVKDKSIDPTLLISDDFKRLTGLVPIQKKLGKGGTATDTSTIPEAVAPLAYRIVKSEDGGVKSYLYCGNTDRILTWESNAHSPTGKTLCTFFGDTTNPYLADWDLVLVGVSKNSIKAALQPRGIFKVVDQGVAPLHSILPLWLDNNLRLQTAPLSAHVTQHGPESLYCGNDITQPNEEFLVLTLPQAQSSSSGQPSSIVINSQSSGTGTPWAKTQDHINTKLQDYFLYQFSGFTGHDDNKPTDYAEAIKQLNSTIDNLR